MRTRNPKYAPPSHAQSFKHLNVWSVYVPSNEPLILSYLILNQSGTLNSFDKIGILKFVSGGTEMA